MTGQIQLQDVKTMGNIDSQGTILFSHGFGTTKEVWGTVAEPFSKDWRIVLYDIVGCRPETEGAFSPKRYDSLNAYVEDLIDVCDAVGLKGVIYVGHSMSGMIGIEAAVRRPDLFSKLVLIAASACYLDEPGYRGGFSRQALDDMFESMRTNYFAWASGFGSLAMGNPENPTLSENFIRSLRAMRPDIALSVLKVFMKSDIRPDLPRLNLPTLIIQSNDDIAVPLEAALYLRDNIHNSQLAVIEASGHLPHVSAAGAVIEEIKRFLERS